MKYKMFVSDLDGTLLDNNHKISKENVEAIRKLESKGVKFVIATGRTKYILEDYLETVDYKMPLIWSNGSVVSDVNGETLYTEEIPIKIVREIIKLTPQYNVEYMIHTLDGIVSDDGKGRIQGLEDYNNSVLEAHRIPLQVDELLYENLDKYEMLKLSISGTSNEDLKRFQEIVNQKIEGINAVFSDPTLLDITATNATKGRAVLKLAEKYNIKPEEIITIGDNENDLSMLTIGGLGLTLENGIDVVKETAKYITKDNHSSGVADAIERFILK